MSVVPVEEQVVPMEIVDQSLALRDVLSLGVANRPETRQFQALAWEAGQRAHQEQWRPWLPNVQVGTSAGNFGGGAGSNYTNSSGRSDIDVLAVWEMQNLGYGNHARRQRASSEHREAYLQASWMRDRIESEIVTAYSNVQSYRDQIEQTLAAAEAARETYRLNRAKIREGEGLPLELLQAIASLVQSMDAYVDATCDYNQAQYQLVRAIGQTPTPAAPSFAAAPEFATANDQ